MSGRCKACNVILDEFEMERKWPGYDDFCDLCDKCFRASQEDYDPEVVDIYPDIEEWEL